MKIYLASSWRNEAQPTVLASLRKEGHEVYDFKNPAAGNSGFSWKQIDPNYSREAIPERYAQRFSAQWLRDMLAHPVAQEGFRCDFDAMKWADACVLLLPCGMSAHLEAGWFGGAGKPVAILAPDIREPELMYKLFDTRDAWGKPGAYALPMSGWRTPLFDNFSELAEHLVSLPQAKEP